MKIKKLTLACLVVVSIINTGCKKQAAAPASGGGATTPTLTRYSSTCITMGSPTFNANSYKNWLTFTGNTYTFSQLYFVDNGCATPAFTLSTSGTSAIGAATNAPSGGYLINFTPTSSVVTVYDSATDTAAMNTLCGNHWTAGVTSTYNTTSAGLNCGGGSLGIVPVNTVIYNAFVVNGSTLSLGAFTQNNPGTTVSSSVATSTSVDIPSY